MHRFVTCLSLAALLLCAGCATEPGKPAAPKPTAQDVAKIVVGKSTAAEVRALLGTPDRELKLRGDQGNTWGYRHGGREGPRIVWIQISPDGVVREVTDNVDFDLDRRYKGP